jgi:hypothetical protein
MSEQKFKIGEKVSLKTSSYEMLINKIGQLTPSQLLARLNEKSVAILEGKEDSRAVVGVVASRNK